MDRAEPYPYEKIYKTIFSFFGKYAWTIIWFKDAGQTDAIVSQ